MTETQQTPCTEEQKAEWLALSDEMEKVRRQIEPAQSMVAYYMGKHIDPDEKYPLHAYELAKESALEVRALEAEYKAARDRYDAHPYTTEVRGRMADR